MVKKILICISFLLFPCAIYAQFNPGYNEWIKKATDYHDTRQYRQSADAYSHAFSSNGGLGFNEDFYSAACSWAQAGNKDSAFYFLNRITKNGYKDIDQLTADTDLATLHTDNRWNNLCDLIRKNKEKAEVNLNKPLMALLDTIYQSDQQYRSQADNVMQIYGPSSKEVDSLDKLIGKNDSIDLVKIIAIIDQYGWPGLDIAGSKGSFTVCLVIEHAGLATQDKYLPMMREAFKKNKVSPADLALLEDKVSLRHRKKQIYGSQISMDIRGSFIAPLEDPDNVDKRRAEIGLSPLAETLKQSGIAWNVAEYKKQLPDFERRQNNIKY